MSTENKTKFCLINRFFFFFALSFNFSSQIIFRDNFTKGYQIIRYFEIIVLN